MDNHCGAIYTRGILYTHRAPSQNDTLARAANGTAPTCRIMSYNILGASLAAQHAYLYKATHRSHLTWSYRYPLILREILHWAPHALCLQEVEDYEQLQHDLYKHGYDGCYVQRTGDRGDGCATFWRRDTFAVKSETDVYMEQHNLRENVAQIVLLRHLHHPQQPQLLLSNTHTLFNPKRGEVKLGQARVLTSEIAAALEDAGTSHQGPLGVVMCGDYNTLPGSALYRFWAHGSVDCTSVDRRDLAGQLRLRPRIGPGPASTLSAVAKLFNDNTADAAATWSAQDLALALGPSHSGAKNVLHNNNGCTRLSHSLQLTSAYSSVTQQEPPFTTWVSRETGCVDYIWHGTGADGQASWHPTAVLQPPLHGAIGSGLPNEAWPSDHVSLVADFVFSKASPR